MNKHHEDATEMYVQSVAHVIISRRVSYEIRFVHSNTSWAKERERNIEGQFIIAVYL